MNFTKINLGGFSALLPKALLVLIVFVAVSMPAIASNNNVYSAEVAVRGKSQEARIEGLQAALLKVLVRVTGQRKLDATDSAVAAVLDQAPQLIEQYRYFMSGEGGMMGTAPQRLMLHAEFGPKIVRQAVREGGLPLWGSSRPDVLLWLLQEEQEGQWFVADDNKALVDAIAAVERERGVTMRIAVLPPPVVVDGDAAGLGEVLEADADAILMTGPQRPPQPPAEIDAMAAAEADEEIDAAAGDVGVTNAQIEASIETSAETKAETEIPSTAITPPAVPESSEPTVREVLSPGPMLDARILAASLLPPNGDQADVILRLEFAKPAEPEPEPEQTSLSEAAEDTADIASEAESADVTATAQEQATEPVPVNVVWRKLDIEQARRLAGEAVAGRELPLVGESADKPWQTTAPDLPQAIQIGLHKMVDAFADEFAVQVVEEGEQVLLEVVGVDSLISYAQLGRYLGEVSTIDELQMRSFSNGVVIYELSLKGSASRLQAALKLGTLLRPNTEAELVETQPPTLHYRIAGN